LIGQVISSGQSLLSASKGGRGLGQIGHKTVIFAHHNELMMTADAPSYQTITRGLSYLLSSYLLPTYSAGLYLLYAVVCLAGETPSVNDTAQAQKTAILENNQLLSTDNYQQISEWHLFGQAEVATPNDTEIVETQLQLKLLGTFVSSTLATAMSAVVQSDDGSQKKYKVGDTLPGGAVLEEIFTSRVLLSHNGRRESLALQRQDASLASNAN
jgi:general secretion pathway protein C